MSDCRRFLVEGKVQGVWFRESTRQQAQRLQISGHAINLPDGRVEVIACGDAVAISELAEWLRQGPRLARVTAVVSEPCEPLSSAGFRTG
jgi:acylphosphatase